MSILREGFGGATQDDGSIGLNTEIGRPAVDPWEIVAPALYPTGW